METILRFNPQNIKINTKMKAKKYAKNPVDVTDCTREEILAMIEEGRKDIREGRYFTLEELNAKFKKKRDTALAR